ncbi:hypothetical protein LG047_12735 [Methylocystis sp. WRRC1]|uniref:helix-turn-helix domain-containing protein n=1 Tax=unclassified Methylocystis TaxID=2625913 RepID=UPI0001F86846|nr:MULTISPECIES: helix-turn-helix domain-containing protein [unclassified Methylocystis]MCC3246176.1 hypothetical protein [Methylocystis sp. WRRC1]
MSAPVHISDIIEVVCEQYRVTQTDIRSARRTGRLVEPRHIAAYLAAKLTDKSLPQIGLLMRRDHTSVLHGRDRIAARVAEDATFAEHVYALELACVSLSMMRGRGVLPAPVEPIVPHDLARRIMAGGRRAAMRVSPDHVLELCEALISAHDFETENGAPAPVLVPAPPVALSTLVRDFLALEAGYRRSPSINLRELRDRAIDSLRDRVDDDDIRALVVAADILRRAEYTAAERDAQARYQRAVNVLSKRFPDNARKEQETNG